MPDKPRPHWKDDPEKHDYPAAADYLSLLFPPEAVAALVEGLRSVEAVDRAAKDILRASRLPLLPADDPHVAKDLRKASRGDRLSPVLLVRGRGQDAVALIVADGYHRVCASYHLDENTSIRCRLVDIP